MEDGKPKNSWLTSVNPKGEFIRKDSIFRNWIQKGGEFPPEKGRYHLYISHACPWANRTVILVNLKGLQESISHSVVHYFLGEKGWSFATPESPVEGCLPDPLGHHYLREIYHECDPEYSGNITVPVLFDLKTKKIVNNESSEIIRMLNTEFNEFCPTEEQKKLNFYPEELKEKIDEINSWVYPNINNGVYRCGFAQSQEAYDQAVQGLFEHLEKVENILSQSRYLTGNRLTEADIRLFTTLIRFDIVYYVHFKTNLKFIKDFHNVYNYMLELYQIPAIKQTVNFFHIKHHYFESHRKINQFGIVPKGPLFDYNVPHDRESLNK